MNPVAEIEVLQPSERYLLLGMEGAVATLSGGPGFWEQTPAELDRLGQQWMVAEFMFQHDWPTWERHPDGDELVYVLEGSATLLLDHDGEVSRMTVDAPGLVVIPRGIWHTAQIHRPCRFLQVTRGRGTELRAV